MKFVIDGVEVALAARDDDTIDEIKEKFGRPVYLYAKRRVHRTARDIYNLFGRPLTAAELRTVFSNLNISKEVTKAVYTFHDLIELAVGGRHTAWVALGQTMGPSVPVVPGDGADPRHEARLLLDYLPIVGDTVYGTTAAPAYTLPLTRAVRAPLALPSSDLEAEGLHSVHLALPSTSDLPLPLDYLFTVLHASSDVPLIGRGSRYRAHGAVRAPATFNGLTCWFDTSGWLTATFYRDGHVEVLFQCPATEMVPMGALAAVLRPVNRFIHGVNNTLRWGTPLEDRGACSNSEGFPLFESVELADVRDMSYMYVADFVGSRVEPPLREAFARVRCVPSVHATATSTILRVDHVPPAALGCLRAYARACLHELRQADAHSYGFHQPRTVRAQASADLEPREYVWNLPRMVWAPRPLFALRGAQVEAPGLEPGFAAVQRYLGPNFYRTPAAPFLQCLATHLSRTVEELKALILARARAMLPLYPNLILHFSTNMTSSVRNHTPFVNFRNYLESEESIDFTFVWELVGDILGANLVLFNGDALYGKIEVIAPCQATLDPSKETVLLFKQEGGFALIYEAVRQFDASYPFLAKVARLYEAQAPSLTAGEVVRKLRGAKYKRLQAVTHRNQTIGFATLGAGFVPCYPEAGEGQDVRFVPSASGVEVDAFLREVHARTRLPCRLTHLVQGGAVTERYLFVPCTPPFPALPPYHQNIAHEYKSATSDPYPTPLPFAEQSEQRYAMARQRLRDVLTADEKARIRAILADARAKSARLEEIVRGALASHVVLVPSVPRDIFLVGAKVLLTEANVYERFAEELADYVHYRAFILGDTRVVGGVEYDVHPGELLVAPFKVARGGVLRIAGRSCSS